MDQKAYEKFKSTRQENLKLALAVKLCLEDAKTGPADCEAYLRLRQRPAAVYLIREGKVKPMKRLAARPWFRRDYLQDYLLQAGKQGNMELVALLFSVLKEDSEENRPDAWEQKGEAYRSGDVSGADAGRKSCHKSPDILAKQIIELTLQEILQTYPALGGVLAALEPVRSETIPLGTDGEHLFYQPAPVCLKFMESRSCLTESILHVICHCLLLHIFLPGDGEDSVLEQQADSQAEHILGRPLSHPLLKDGHSCWPGKNFREEKQKIRHLSEKWHRLQTGAGAGLSGGHSRDKRGLMGVQEYERRQKKAYDYRRFLSQFMIRREMQQLDMENFDPIWYHYSREMYDGLVFLEPQETTEVTRLSEILIAIDTSASCQGPVVQRFLDETFSILQKQEHFFRQMRVHIVQCDFMVEDYACITCERDWKDYQRNLKIHGLGDTDFCPVFAFAGEMSKKGEIRDLKGILYFTDGDGIFPNQAPPWPTAFVFLNDELEKHELPDWAIRLNLHVKV